MRNLAPFGENATVLNAALMQTLKQMATGFVAALRDRGIPATPYFGQNDGTLMDAAFAEKFLSVSDIHFNPFADPTLVTKLEAAEVSAALFDDQLDHGASPVASRSVGPGRRGG